jgi:hypothetical protein
MLPKVQWQNVLDKRKLTRKDFFCIVTLLDGDRETSTFVMKDNIGCGGQTVWHVMRDRKQNVTYKAVDGSPKAKPPPCTHDCELWLENAPNKEVCSFEVLENHPRMLFHVPTAWGENGTVTYSDVFCHDMKHADHPTLHNLVKDGYACMNQSIRRSILPKSFGLLV